MTYIKNVYNRTPSWVAWTVSVIVLLALGYQFALWRGHRDPLPAEAAPPMPQARAAYERVVGTSHMICGIHAAPPYAVFDPHTGRVTGMMKEIGDALGAVLGIRMEYVESLAGQQAVDLKNSRIDAHCFDAPAHQQHMRVLDYGETLFYVPIDAYGRAARGLNNPSTTFLAIDGDTTSVLPREYFPSAKITTKPELNNVPALLAEVAKNNTYAVVASANAVADFNKKNPSRALRKLTTRPIMYLPISISTHKGDPMLRNMVDDAIRLLHTKGTLNRIVRRYDSTGTRILLPAPGFIPPSVD